MEGSELLWGVGAVADRLGIATPTLRTWERRYGIGPSQRTSGGHRRYSETDIRRVQMMNRIVSSGVPAQSAARVALSLDPAGLLAALDSDEPGASRPAHVLATPAESRERIEAAACELDVVGLSDLLSDTMREWGVIGGWVNVLAPSLAHLDLQVAVGAAGEEVRRLARDRVESELRSLSRGFGARFTGVRPVVLTSVEPERESLTLLALEAALAAKGVAAVNLGCAITPGALGAAVGRLAPAAVYVWSMTEDVDWLDAVVADAPPTTSFLLGGEGWAPSRPVVGEGGREAERAPDLLATTDRLITMMQTTPQPG
ncbi:MerR-like DNA binding protein [Mumia flava]|uniref:MerR-like DNA binding protein n=1 Tax=Mumia flava TaxID=1348852 RepID=A0A2M9BDW6_9ACTN|nr:MerR family transcriptional regulator [Mumia flava]PJJ56151.1 MerR-like DNA binding protein [Mumia flava]